MKKIEYALRDVGGFPSIMKFLSEYMPEEYQFAESKNPDYLICSCFGKSQLEDDTVRIVYIGENLVPDFNIYDYAIGFDNIIFDDRYLRYPIYAFSYRDAFLAAVRKHENVEEILGEKETFCSFMVSNGHADDVRTKFFLKLSEYKKVASGGKFMNNIGGFIKGIDGKLEFQKKCKFAIAFENSCTPGYTTEKLIQAWQAGAIPIYWGNPEVAKEFNSKSFINCHEYENMDQVIEQVKRIDMDEELYLSMLKEPILFDGCIAEKYVDMKYLTDFLVHIFEQSKEEAIRRNDFTSKFSQNYGKQMRKQLDTKQEKGESLFLGVKCFWERMINCSARR